MMYVQTFLMDGPDIAEQSITALEPADAAYEYAVATMEALTRCGYLVASFRGDGRHEAAFLVDPDSTREAIVTVSPDIAHVQYRGGDGA